MLFRSTNAIDWANEKRQQEIEETALLEKYPSLKSAKGQYDMIKQLCQAEEDLLKNV